MQTDPPNAAPPKRKRRRFQFSLRTLLVVVTLLAVVCAYVGRQAMIVRERESVLAEIENAGGGFFSDVRTSAGFWGRFAVWPDEAITSIESNEQKRSPARTDIRRLLGDEAVLVIWLPAKTAPAETARIKLVIPEAYVWRF